MTTFRRLPKKYIIIIFVMVDLVLVMCGEHIYFTLFICLSISYSLYWSISQLSNLSIYLFISIYLLNVYMLLKIIIMVDLVMCGEHIYFTLFIYLSIFLYNLFLSIHFFLPLPVYGFILIFYLLKIILGDHTFKNFKTGFFLIATINLLSLKRIRDSNFKKIPC